MLILMSFVALARSNELVRCSLSRVDRRVSDCLIYSNILAHKACVIVSLSLPRMCLRAPPFGFDILRFAHKPYGRHLSPSTSVLSKVAMLLSTGSIYIYSPHIR